MRPRGGGVVVAAGLRNMTFVGMDATFSAPLDGAAAARLHALGTTAGRAAARFLEQRIDWYARDPAMSRIASAPLHDPLAVAHVLDRGIVDTRPATCRLDLTPGEDYGRTVYDFDPERSDLSVGLAADTRAFLHFLTDALG